MKIREQLSWILDDTDSMINKDYKTNIDFCHSLGLKCDCVGWSTLDLDRPDADEILDKIEAFCHENGWWARGGMGRYVESEEGDEPSEWYELTNLPRQKSWKGFEEITDENGNELSCLNVEAYKERGSLIAPNCHYLALASEHFKETCEKYHIPNLKFVWVKDVGKYEGTQYFHILPTQSLPHIAFAPELRYGNPYKFIPHVYDPIQHARLTALGGKGLRISEIFYCMGFGYHYYYPKKEMPENGFLYIPSPKSSNSYEGFQPQLLVHRTTAEILLKENLINKKNLTPALLYDEVPGGYKEQEMPHALKLPDSYLEKMQKEYEYLKEHPKPKRKATEIQTLKLLRLTKKDRKSDFNKGLKRTTAQALLETEYAPLVPYYLLSNGFCLSDEYEVLPYEKTQQETLVFDAKIEKEEFLESIPKGIVIARCPDGDRVLLRPNGTVERYSHEEPTVAKDCPTLAQFIMDCCENDY